MNTSDVMESIKIAIADDHVLFREGLAGILAASADFEVVWYSPEI